MLAVKTNSNADAHETRLMVCSFRQVFLVDQAEEDRLGQQHTVHHVWRRTGATHTQVIGSTPPARRLGVTLDVETLECRNLNLVHCRISRGANQGAEFVVVIGRVLMGMTVEGHPDRMLVIMLGGVMRVLVKRHRQHRHAAHRPQMRADDRGGYEITSHDSGVSHERQNATNTHGKSSVV